MKYLVTGADGFLGRHFLAALAGRGVQRRAMIQEGLGQVSLPGGPEIVRAELLKDETLPAAVEGITHIIHLAARVHVMDEAADESEKAFFETNVEGTRHLIEAAADAGVSRFLLMSTVKAMGEEDSGVFDENTPPRPTSPYGRSKLAAEQVVFELARKHGLHAVVLRLPMVYGPGAKGNVLRLLEAAERGRKLPVGAVGNRRSMVYVTNVVDAALAAMDHSDCAGQVYLVCDERPYSTKEFYSAICKAMGKAPLLRNTPLWLLRLLGRCGDLAKRITGRNMPIDSGVVRRITGDLCFSSEKIQTTLGLSPAVGLEEGIKRTVLWYQKECPPTP